MAKEMIKDTFRILVDGATFAGKTTVMGHFQSYLDGLRDTVNLCPEMAWLCLEREQVEKDSTDLIQTRIFEMQKDYEKLYSINYRKEKVSLICDRGAPSSIPYIKFGNFTPERKVQLIQEIMDYTKANPYDFCIYMEPLNTISKKASKWQQMLDRETRAIYEQLFTKGENLFYIPVDVGSSKYPKPFDSELKNAKFARNQYVMELVEKILSKA